MYDMIIAGGGPAGAITAERAVKNELSVLVLEKETYPGDKTSGCGVSQKALDAIGGINKELIECDVFCGRIFLPGYQGFSGRLGSRVPVIARRENF